MFDAIVTWPAPPSEAPSPAYVVSVDAAPVFVYAAAVRTAILQKEGLWSHAPGAASEQAAFAMFDLRKPATVTVRPTRPFHTAAVLPERAGITPEVTNGCVRFAIRQPEHLTVILDGSDQSALHLFIGEPETEVPRPDDPNVVYFGPGVHEVQTLDLKDGQTVYLAGGAILKAVLPPGDKGQWSDQWKITFHNGTVLNIDRAKDVRICGRGILDGSLIPHPGRNLIGVHNSRNVRLEGIMLRDSPNWNVIIDRSEDVRVTDLRLISGRLNSDGINSVNSKKVRIRRCFVRNHDDSIVVKTTQPGAPAEDIAVDGCTVWNDWGYAFGVTYETRSPVSRVSWRHCNVICARHWCLGVRLSDSATVSDVTFSDLDVSGLPYSVPAGDSRPALTSESRLAHILIARDCWGHDPECGRVRDVTVEGVTIHGGRMLSTVIEGADAEHDVRGVTFRDVHLAGQPSVTDAEGLCLQTNAFVRDVRILP